MQDLYTPTRSSNRLESLKHQRRAPPLRNANLIVFADLGRRKYRSQLGAGVPRRNAAGACLSGRYNRPQSTLRGEEKRWLNQLHDGKFIDQNLEVFLGFSFGGRDA
jgi:hypothetical protein